MHQIHSIAQLGDVKNQRNIPVVSNTQLIVQKAHPISKTGVEWITPGTA